MKSTALFAVLFSLFSFLYSTKAFAVDLAASSFYTSRSPLSTKLYDELDLDQYGMSQTTLDYAVKGYENLLSNGLVTRSQYLTIVDYSQPINNKRFYLLDVQNLELVLNTYVMHGRNTGAVFAEQFSNMMNSYQSSLGFYLTKKPYNGQRGYSLRLEGLEKGFNDNALARGIVLHGSNYINDERAQSGRIEHSLGCPAIPKAENKKVIELIKDGSVLFVYHPTDSYLQQSMILNWNTLPSPTLPLVY